jgi:organic hydroperoxide reductase OsmC/OhrA
MSKNDAHCYELALDWEGNRGDGTADYATYGRGYRVRIAGKPDLLGSADPRFRGDAGLHDPEDLLLAAVAGCHLLSYLALCARRRIVVVAYRDAAVGTLLLTPDGGGRFAEITLRPRVTVARASDRDAAAALHERAHELCFIANSCRFPIRCEPEIVVEAAAASA